MKKIVNRETENLSTNDHSLWMWVLLHIRVVQSDINSAFSIWSVTKM